MQIVEGEDCFEFARDTRVEGGQFSLAGEPYILGVLHSGLGPLYPSGILKFVAVGGRFRGG